MYFVFIVVVVKVFLCKPLFSKLSLGLFSKWNLLKTIVRVVCTQNITQTMDSSKDFELESILVVYMFIMIFLLTRPLTLCKEITFCSLQSCDNIFNV